MMSKNDKNVTRSGHCKKPLAASAAWQEARQFSYKNAFNEIIWIATSLRS